MNYKETLDVLYNMMPDFQRVGADAYKPGLERVTEFNNLLGRPDGRFRSVHVAGTNGKGSVSHMLASVLQASGLRVGLYTSPHLRDFRERIRIDGEMIPEREVTDFADKYLETMRVIGLSFFEATMCMAFDWFALEGVSVAVVETGLGGRLDSTNIISPLLSVITNIGLDHQKFLGDTVGKIAAEKAGIIKRGVPVVIGERDAATDHIFVEKAAEVGAPIVFAEDLYRCERVGRGECSQAFRVADLMRDESYDLSIDLMGGYQSRNVATALAAVSELRRVLPIGEHSVGEGMAHVALSTGLRGRWEVIGREPLTVCDTGHNAHGLRLVAEQLRGERYDKLYMVVGMVDDKDFDSVLPLLPHDAHYIFTSPSVPRALPAAELAAKGTAYGLIGDVVPTVPEALAHARKLAGPGDMIFVGGSTFTVADII